MTPYLLSFVGALVVLVVVLAHSHVAALLAQLRDARASSTSAARRTEEFASVHAEQVESMARAHDRTVNALLAGFSAEREQWTQERQVLITRIQDPTAGVAASLTMLPPAAAEYDMDHER